jgi:hypothetical protein
MSSWRNDIQSLVKKCRNQVATMHSLREVLGEDPQTTMNGPQSDAYNIMLARLGTTRLKYARICVFASSAG